MFRCPHCQDAGIAPLKKAILSPGLLATCKLCGQTSSTRYTSWLVAMIPGSILMLAALVCIYRDHGMDTEHRGYYFDDINTNVVRTFIPGRVTRAS